MLRVFKRRKLSVLIATWNVNSIRTRMKQVQAWIDEFKPDLLCLQETKVEDSIFPYKEFENIGYTVRFHGQKSYNGVAILSCHQIEDVRLGLSGELPNNSEAEELGKQKRVISALVEGIRIVNVYVPNGSSVESEKYTYKITKQKIKIRMKIVTYLKTIKTI